VEGAEEARRTTKKDVGDENGRWRSKRRNMMKRHRHQKAEVAFP